MNFFTAKRYIQYILKPNHWKGFGIHSPFIFDLVANLFREKHKYHAFTKINAARKALLNSSKKIEITDLGAGSTINKSNTRTISNIAKHSSIPQKYGELIFRLVCYFKPGNILEFGTSLGIGTAYMATPNSNTKVITIEGCSQTANVASNTFETLSIHNVTLINSEFSSVLPKVLNQLKALDFVFFDGNHKYEPTISYFNTCIKYAHNNSIFIFDDIHLSPEMEKAWNEIINDSRITVSLDLFRLGIVFFRKESKKEHFVVRF